MLSLALMSPSLLHTLFPAPGSLQRTWQRRMGFKQYPIEKHSFCMTREPIPCTTGPQNSISALPWEHLLLSKAIASCQGAPRKALGVGFQEWVLWGPFCQQVWGKRPADTSEQSREWGKPLQGNVQYAGHTQAASIGTVAAWNNLAG